MIGTPWWGKGKGKKTKTMKRKMRKRNTDKKVSFVLSLLYHLFLSLFRECKRKWMVTVRVQLVTIIGQRKELEEEEEEEGR